MSISAYRNATPAVVDAPLIAFPHGFLAIRFQSAFLMEHLAQHGFVVIAPDHPNNTFLDFDDDETGSVFLERPDDIRASVDEISLRVQDEDEFLYRIAYAETYSVTDHSFGSHTAMVLGGGVLDCSGLLIYCEENPESRPCSYLSDLDPDFVSEHGDADSRVVTSVPISTGLWCTFGVSGEGLGSLNNSLTMAGGLDTVLDYETEALPTFSALGEPKTLAIVPGAGHYGFTDICLLAEAFTPECGSMDSPEYLEIDTTKQITKTIVTASLGSKILLDDRYSPWLDAEAWDRNLL